MSFGTGALKITPAHDPNDFEIGNHHNLERIKVIGDNGRMTPEAGKFQGLDRFECREAVINALKEEGLLEKIEPYQHSIGHCYRCKTIIEPNLSKQWFVKTKPLAKKAIDAVKNGDTKIIPEIWTKTYFEWMNNIKDWCISRQIWWGHQIPAWTCNTCKEIIVSMDAPTTCPACGGTDLSQDTDVLDTWFSSALWPFSTMGWPDQTPLLKLFYPTSVLVTGFDILFFWVARMMMMGIHFMKAVPFKDVYVHALVRDEDGKKMSKSTGNVIDPLIVMDRYGTDAFRFTLAAFAAQGRDVKMSEKRVEGYRNFINKIWNAARFSLTYITQSHNTITTEPLSLVDRWILSRLYRVREKVTQGLDNYRFNDAAGALYKFVWHEFCDWYLEAIKPTLYGKEGEDLQQATLGVLWRVLHDTLVLLHPFVPFITEEIWHKLPGTQGSIMKAAFPLYSDSDVGIQRDEEAESHMGLISGIITGIRNIRGEMNISPSLSLAVSAHSQNEPTNKTIQQYRNMIVNLARLKSLSVGNSVERPKSAATAVVDDATIFVSLEGIVDFAKEIERLEKEINKLTSELSVVSKKLNNEDFLSKAPAPVVEKVKEKNHLLAEKHEKLLANLDKIKQLDA
jgi:valyl-tRNA synthetase